MSVATNNCISVNEYYKINPVIVIENMCLLKITTVLLIVGALGMIKKGTHELINKTPSNPSLYEIEKIVELLIFSGEYYQ